MPLPSTCIPLTSSLRSRVLEGFSPAVSPPPGETLNRRELIGYLARSKTSDSSPLATIQRRARKEHSTPNLTSEDQAILAWVSASFSAWEVHYALEAPLSIHIRRLAPLAAAMALTEETFCIPGVHPLHQLLDALQNGAVGWQRRLDRAGQMLEQRVERAVEKALEWFVDEKTDLSAVTRELVAANERDAARAQRMVQRLAETEEARLKTLNARRDAAREINRGLAKYPLPAAIGEFLTGPWYDSAQLALMKFGDKSTEWDQMRRATEHLMQSVQRVENGNDAERDRQEQILRHLPGQLRRWLLSLGHDEDATDGAIGLVEYAHLRLQYGQQLQLVKIQPIALDADALDKEDDDEEPLETGQWYRFEDNEGELRAQLVLQIGGSEHLLFANFVGLKALDLPRKAFNQRVDDGFAVTLQCEHTFSISLAAAAGINSEEQLERFRNPQPVAHRRDPEALTQQSPEASHALPGMAVPGIPQTRGSSSNSAPIQTREPHSRAGNNANPDAPLILDTADTLDTQEWSLGGDNDYEAAIDPVLAPPPGAEVQELELEPAPPDYRDTSQSLELELEAPTAPAPPPPQQPAVAIPEIQAPAAPPSPRQSPPPIAPSAPRMPAPAAPNVPPARPPAPPTPVSPQPSTPPPIAPEPPAAAAPEVSAENTPKPRPEIVLPMGAWLGFHDGETPIMAKLAVFDPRRDNYIFVNRQGIAMRELNKAELADLVDKGLVDILETRCYFRDEVERAREEDS